MATCSTVSVTSTARRVWQPVPHHDVNRFAANSPHAYIVVESTFQSFTHPTLPPHHLLWPTATGLFIFLYLFLSVTLNCCNYNARCTRIRKMLHLPQRNAWKSNQTLWALQGTSVLCTSHFLIHKHHLFCNASGLRTTILRIPARLVVSDS